MTGGEMSDFLVGGDDGGAAAVRVRYPEHICSKLWGRDEYQILRNTVKTY